jgi:hypothetical protein
MTKKQDIPDGVEIRWSYRPDDRAKQGETEFLPRDLARQKVREGLAVRVQTTPEPEPQAEPESDAPRIPKKTVAPTREG